MNIDILEMTIDPLETSHCCTSSIQVFFLGFGEDLGQVGFVYIYI